MAFSPRFLVVLVISLPYKVCLVRGQIFASEGQRVVLPCNYTRVDPPLPPRPTVIWKDPEDRVLLKLEGGEVVKAQPRVEILQGKPALGIFSVQISDVRMRHSGNYECHVPIVGFQRAVNLTVTERKEKNEEEKSEDGSQSPRGAAAEPQLSVALLMVGTVLHLKAFL